ncbi:MULTISPECIES: hypothetical protein [unclassified Saccharothrix]|uniref:hypothetical protein n=1 Tax=unclassified Saccharothrix TaxID=2593673 RepID=UPI00307F018D
MDDSSSSSHDSSADDDFDDFDDYDDYDHDVEEEDDGYDPHFHHRSRRRRGLDLVDAPGWVKACVWIGMLTAVAGLGVFFLELITAMGTFGDNLDDPGPFGTSGPQRVRDAGPDPSKIGLAFGLFFVGFVLAMIGNLGNASTRRR